ncbi:capsule biosynthesis protein CapG [Sphingomonas panacis]|uniref:Acetyltransferase n=2 Tax=Sphingomonas panacis TaxID=1560345 RepID=A0A1B3ZA18_9SPHN|nr:capsule biosynthesis protein CapG [Sphingomonas panacis]
MAKRILAYVDRRRDPEGYARRIGVRMGKGCRLIDVEFSTEPWLITLGDRVSATRTRFETHDGGVWVFRESDSDIDIIKPITVGSNVFIGYGTIILPGVTIGDNVVIGAGSVVSRDIPSDSVAVGVPARAIKTFDAYRDSTRAAADPTKSLNPKDKRAYFEKKYCKV